MTSGFIDRTAFSSIKRFLFFPRSLQFLEARVASLSSLPNGMVLLHSRITSFCPKTPPHPPHDLFFFSFLFVLSASTLELHSPYRKKLPGKTPIFSLPGPASPPLTEITPQDS